jgi:hypothetical protein
VFLYIHYARLLAQKEGPDAARGVFNAALVVYPNYKSLWHAFLTFEVISNNRGASPFKTFSLHGASGFFFFLSHCEQKRQQVDDREEKVNAIYDRAVHGDHCT